MTQAVLEPRKAPRQARSRATYDAIVKAAATILAREGQSGLNTNHVARKAGVSIGSLYQYFPNKQAIVIALLREMRGDMLERIETAADNVGEVGLHATVRAMVRARLRQHFRQSALTEALERIEAELPVDAEIDAQKRRSHAIIVAVLAEHYVDDPETVARDVVAMCRGMTQAAVGAGEQDFEALALRLDIAVTGYLSAVAPED